MNPYIDPRKVGPVQAAGNLFWAVACVPLYASIWLPGAIARAIRSSEDAD